MATREGQFLRHPPRRKTQADAAAIVPTAAIVYVIAVDWVRT